MFVTESGQFAHNSQKSMSNNHNQLWETVAFLDMGRISKISPKSSKTEVRNKTKTDLIVSLCEDTLIVNDNDIVTQALVEIMKRQI